MKKGVDFRLLDFKEEDAVNVSQESNKYVKNYEITMFGKNESGETAAITVQGFKPYFYIKVGEDWDDRMVGEFYKELFEPLRKEELKRNYDNWRRGKIKILVPPISKDDSKERDAAYANRLYKKYKCTSEKEIEYIKLVKKKKLYGFDNHTEHKFILLKFKSVSAYNKIKNLWYNRSVDKNSKFGYSQQLKKKLFNKCLTELYEAKLPPLLRFFHVYNISPSGWIRLPPKKYKKTRIKKTRCTFEFTIKANDIISLPKKELPIPLKICSFDIEASSSHGDFPMPKKTYKKLAGELQQYWTKYKEDIEKLSLASKRNLLQRQLKTAFELFSDEELLKSPPCEGISKVFTKDEYLIDTFRDNDCPIIIKSGMQGILKKSNCDEEISSTGQTWMSCIKAKRKNRDGKDYAVIDCLLDDIDPADKVDQIDAVLIQILPELEGDKVTFIGSTFWKVGDDKPYLNHGVCLNTCTDYGGNEIQIVPCETETDLLLGWTKMIQEEQPDVIIGYNIFGFDYKFMCDRAEELDCEKEFYDLGRIIDKTYKRENQDKEKDLKYLRRNKRLEKELRIASGAHQLTYINIEGIIQIDLYNYFRREVNLGSYKLQDVASHFIGDMISGVDNGDGETSIIKSRNLMGLQKDNYVIFEIIGNSLDPYENGKKFQVTDINETEGYFTVNGQVTIPDNKKMRWGLGKDDVSPQDLFRLTNGTADDRQIIAKYCFQDCNLVHNLLRKNDVFTGMSEVASICSVPIDFIIMRGQGIKLLSFIAKRCRELNTLMPVLDKAGKGGYEGAICLPPEKGFYSNNPVAVVDYASLYPSSMISENISHDSKVWSKEYDLEGNFIKEQGEKNEDGGFIYDNLPEIKYVDIEYDTYDYKVHEGKKKEEKTKVGKKICRYAQFPDNEMAIMPNILTELLSARKATRELIKYKTVETNDGMTISGLVKEAETEYIVKNKTETRKINKKNVSNICDTYTDFMKNVFNQRQLGYKVTANSLYGQCGAKTSAFFEMDIAASTTAIGRKLLTYAERVIQEVYKDRIVDTKFGKRRMDARVVYGDTDSCFFTFNFKDLEGNDIDGKEALELTIKYAIEAGKISSKFLKQPHDLEYEKTFVRFFLLSKKRYVGMLFERDINKGTRKSMGIVLKRRDNADIVKDIYGGVLDILMKDGDVNKAVCFTKQFLQNIVDGKVDIKKLIISKALRDWYKNPESIAHKVLADRMGKRDPGNKPAVGSRVPYVYIQTKGNVKLQGDKIENPGYIKKHNLKLDYMFYITNQIMKPLQQLFGLILEDIEEFNPQLSRFKRRVNSLARKYPDVQKLQAQEDKLRNAEVKKLIFNDALLQINNDQRGQNNITKYTKVIKTPHTQTNKKVVKTQQIPQTTVMDDYKNNLIQQTIQSFLN